VERRGAVERGGRVDGERDGRVEEARDAAVRAVEARDVREAVAVLEHERDDRGARRRAQRGRLRGKRPLRV